MPIPKRKETYTFADPLTLEMKACLLVKVAPGKHNEAVAAMRRLSGIKVVFSTLGRQDVVANVEVGGTRELASLASQVQALPNVRGTETLIGVEV